MIWKAYGQAGVAVDKAAFREAYVYAERELARTRHILPEHDFNDLLNIKMQIELQWLAENGHFAPAEIDAKARDIAGICYACAKEQVSCAIPVLDYLSKKYRLVLVSNFYGELGCGPEEALVVGDSYKKDIEPAEKIGCQAIWIKGKGWTEAEDAQTFPNTITDITELLKIL